MAAKLQPFIDNHVIAGAVVLVADRDKVLDLEAVGYSNLPAKKPMKTTDLFYIASMTKCFTAAALMMTVDEGKVNINDPVEKYLPEFKGQMVEEAESKGQRHPPQHPITIKEVMSHTAALPGEPRAKRYTLEEDIKEIAKVPLQWEPGTKFKYSQGPAIGGRIVEAVSGIPYCQFIQQRLLDPLGMKDTTFWPNAEQASHLALTHIYNPQTKTLEPIQHNSELINEGKCGTVPPVILSQFPASMIPSYAHHFAKPTGSLFSTASDLSKFCQMLLNGGTYQGKRYISPAALKQMTSIQTGDLRVGDGVQGYGLGFFVQKKAVDGGPSVGSFGHHGARKTQMWIDPQNQLAVVLMVQCWELTHAQEHDLFTAYRQQATARYGKTSRQGAGSLPNSNRLTAAEKAAGWKLLFDGKTTTGWRDFRKPAVSGGWQVIDGALCRVDKSARDIITTEQYDNFVLELDYKVPPHANSGIIYRVSEDQARAPLTGVEYQILDNTDPQGDSQKSGWAYALYQPPLDPHTGKPLDATRPVGQWNHVKLVCDGPRIQHWMNGVKYCEYEIGSEDWKERVARAKYARWPRYAKNARGHIALQGDHGDVCFANIKLLPLPAK